MKQLKLKKDLALKRQQLHMGKHEVTMIDQQMIRRNHLYRGMEKGDYHEYFDSMYNLIMDQ